MKPALKNGAFMTVSFFSTNLTNQPMLHGYAPRPAPFKAEPEGFRFAQTLKWLPLNGFYQFPDFMYCIQIRFQPVGEIFPAITGKFNLHCSEV